MPVAPVARPGLRRRHGHVDVSALWQMAALLRPDRLLGRAEGFLGATWGAAALSRWCRLCAGALCKLTAAFGRISSSTSICSRCSHLESWTLLLCPRIFQSWFGAWVLPVKYCVLDFWGSPSCCLVRQWIHSSRGFGRNFHIFYVAVNSNPESFRLHSRRMERACTVDASVCSCSQRCSHLDAGHYF